VLSGRGLCDELITRPEESYRLCCVVLCDLETSRMGAPYIYDIGHLRVNTEIDARIRTRHGVVLHLPFISRLMPNARTLHRNRIVVPYVCYSRHLRFIFLVCKLDVHESVHHNTIV